MINTSNDWNISARKFASFSKLSQAELLDDFTNSFKYFLETEVANDNKKVLAACQNTQKIYCVVGNCDTILITLRLSYLVVLLSLQTC